MALFNLTDISFSSSKGPTGALAPLAGTAYATNTFRYPEDLGSTDKAHYIVFNVNEQRMTSYSGTPATGDKPTSIMNNNGYGNLAAGTTTLNNTLGEAITAGAGAVSSFGTYASAQLSNLAPESWSKKAGESSLVQFTTTLGQGLMGYTAGLGKALQEGANLRAERRITDTVALYMPDTLNFVDTQGYETPGAGGNPITALASAGKSAIDTIRNTNDPKAMANGLVQNMSPFIAAMIAKQFGSVGQIAFSAATGVVQNPMLEVLYSTPSFRQFRFDFMFYPRSEKESKMVQDIIARFRFHQAPEVASQYGNGYFMVPPSEFDISFYYNGKINPNIPKISNCVMESMDVDYAPNGFSAYEVPGESAQLGRTGMPVAIRMSLQFKETEIMTKTAYKAQDVSAKYNTNLGSQQTNMLAEQERGFN
jgi:hypothetical protein